MSTAKDPSDEEHDDLKTWAPSGFDSSVFDLVSANRMLQRIR